MVNPTLTALPGVPVPFANAVTTLQLPPVYTTSGQLAFPNGRTNEVAPNTEIDVPRYQADLCRTHPRRPAAASVSVWNGPEFPQRLHRQLYGGNRADIQGRSFQRLLCGHRGRASCQRRSAPTVIPAPRPSSRPLRSSIPPARSRAGSGRSTSWARLPTPPITPCRFPPRRTLRAWVWAFNPAIPLANRSTIPAPSW